MNINRSTIYEKTMKKMVEYFFIIALVFTGLISFMAIYNDIKLLKLWKEIYILLFVIITLLIGRNYYKLRSIIICSIIFLIYILILLSNFMLNIDTSMIMYQLKNDFIPLVFAFSFYGFVNACKRERIYVLARNIIKIIIVAGCINLFAGLLQMLFPEYFLSLIGINGNWGTSTGLAIFIGIDSLRPIGLQMGFVPFSTICLFCLVLLMDSRVYIVDGWKKKIIIILLVVTIIKSDYYNAIIGLFLFTLYKLIKKYNICYKEINVIVILCMLTFIFFFITTNTYYVYDYIISNIPSMSSKAYGSIFLRINAHQIIWNSLENFKLLFGAGFGVYGMTGLDTSTLASNIGILATDSTWSYLIANYGIVVTVLWLLLMVYILVIISNDDKLGITFLLVYTVVIEFFFNNVISNFPINYILIILIILGLKIRGENKCM